MKFIGFVLSMGVIVLDLILSAMLIMRESDSKGWLEVIGFCILQLMTYALTNGIMDFFMG